MKRLHKFLRLASTERYLLVKSAFLLGAIWLGLWLLPFQTVWRLLAIMTQATTELQEADQASINRVIWAVTVACRYVPVTTCLTQALAIQMLLARRGHKTRLRIGVAKGEGGQLEAHAWVESQGKFVIGGLADISRYTPLPSLEREGL